MPNVTLRVNTDAGMQRCLTKKSRLKLWLVAVCLLTSFCANSAVVERVDGVDWRYTISNGEAELSGSWKDPCIPASTSGTVNVPAMLGGCPVRTVGYAAFSGCSAMEEVVIPSSVKSIGNYAFANCAGLKSVSLPDGIVKVGQGAFDYCTSLTSAPTRLHSATWRMASSSCKKLMPPASGVPVPGKAEGSRQSRSMVK